MKQYKKNYELKNAAKDVLEEKYGGAVLIVFLGGLISGTLNFFIRTVAWHGLCHDRFHGGRHGRFLCV